MCFDRGPQLLQDARSSQAVQSPRGERCQLGARGSLGEEAAAQTGGLCAPARHVTDSQELQRGAFVYQLLGDGVIHPLLQWHDQGVAIGVQRRAGGGSLGGGGGTGLRQRLAPLVAAFTMGNKHGAREGTRLAAERPCFGGPATHACPHAPPTLREVMLVDLFHQYSWPFLVLNLSQVAVPSLVASSLSLSSCAAGGHQGASRRRDMRAVPEHL